MALIEMVGHQFLQTFYNAVQTDRSNVGKFYKESALLIFEGAKAQGQAQIGYKYKNLPYNTLKYDVLKVDVQPISGSQILVTVSGKVKTDDNPKYNYFHVFVLEKVGVSANFLVANETFRTVLSAA